MKKVNYYLVVAIVICSTALLIASQISAFSEKSDIKTQLTNLSDFYGDEFFKAVYSIEELKFFSIIQIEKISQKYNNTWISPEEILTIINKKDKELLIIKLSNYIENKKELKDNNLYIQKIKNWCNADLQLNLIIEKFSKNQDEFYLSLSKIESLDAIISKYTIKHSSDFGKLSPESTQMAYYEIINYISSLQRKEQFMVYSKLFNELAFLEK